MINLLAPMGSTVEEMVESMFRVIRAEDGVERVSSGYIRLRLALIGYVYSNKQVRDALFRLRQPENIYHHYLSHYGFGRCNLRSQSSDTLHS